jgi:hypothetical protein
VRLHALVSKYLTQRGAQPTLSQIVFAIALIPLLFNLGIALSDYVRLAVSSLAFPFPLDYGEGPILDQTIRLLHFENIYRHEFSGPPYSVSNYPPLFQVIQLPLAGVFGAAFWYGRAISIASAIAAAVMIGLVLHALTADRMASAIAGLTLFAFPYIVQWSVLDRVDTLALALSLSGLYVIVRRRDQPLGLLLGALLFAAAIYTRPTYAVAAPLTAFARLWQTRRIRQAFTLLALVASICVTLYVGLNLVTEGGFYLNAIVANLNPWSVQRFMQYASELYLHAGYLVFGCIIYMIAATLGEPNHSWLVVTPYVFGALLASLSAGKVGSSANYFYETATALCLATGALIAWTRENYWLKALIVLVLAMQIGLLVDWSRADYASSIMNKVNAYREVAQLAELVRTAPDPVLADEYMGLLPLYGRRIYLQPFEFRQLQEAQLWSQAPLLAAIQREEFSLVLLFEPLRWNAIVERWTPETRNAIYARYRLENTLAETFVYVPKSAIGRTELNAFSRRSPLDGQIDGDRTARWYGERSPPMLYVQRFDGFVEQIAQVGTGNTQ